MEIQEINKVNRIYKTDKDVDEVVFDVYDLILKKLNVDEISEENS